MAEVHYRVDGEKGIRPLCLPDDQAPDPESRVTATIELCTCIPCLKILHLTTETGLTYVNGSFDRFLQN